MTIAIDYTPAYEQGGGIGRYARGLVDGLASVDNVNDYRLFVAGLASGDNGQLPVAGGNFAWCGTRISPRNLARLWHRLRIPLVVELFTGPINLFHATDFVLPPLLSSTKSILTVHDLSYVRVPDVATPSLRRYLEDVVPRSLNRADYILADSDATRSDIIDVYGVSDARVQTFYCGISSFFSPSLLDMTTRNYYGIPQGIPFLFSIGTVQPRKNYGRLIEALAIIRSRGYDIDLVIAGGKGWLEDPIYAAIETTQMKQHVHFIGYAEEKDLPSLYSAAECVVFPSLYEGFGFPVLEGMACGTPVITSNVSSLPEVAGDAALMIDPYDVEALTDAIQKVLDNSDLRAQMIQRGFEQAKLFTWERSARELRQIYDKVLFT